MPDATVVTPTKLPRMGKESHTKQHSFRIPDEVFYPAKEKAETEGVKLTDVVVRALMNYNRRPARTMRVDGEATPG